MSFASIAALVSHTYLFHGAEIWRRFRSSKGELDDIHMKIMRKYKLVSHEKYHHFVMED